MPIGSFLKEAIWHWKGCVWCRYQRHCSGSHQLLAIFPPHWIWIPGTDLGFLSPLVESIYRIKVQSVLAPLFFDLPFITLGIWIFIASGKNCEASSPSHRARGRGMRKQFPRPGNSTIPAGHSSDQVPVPTCLIEVFHVNPAWRKQAPVSLNNVFSF